MDRNILEHQQRLPIERLPLTFSQAMDFAHGLGFSYLWIDALCIRHDVEEELYGQIKSMASVYMGSALTIFAASANDADSGLASTRDAALTKPTMTEIDAKSLDFALEGPICIHTVTCLGYLCAGLSVPSPYL